MQHDSARFSTRCAREVVLGTGTPVPGRAGALRCPSGPSGVSGPCSSDSRTTASGPWRSSRTITWSAPPKGMPTRAPTNVPRPPAIRPPSVAPTSTAIRTQKGFSCTVLLMMTGLRTWFSICWYTRKTINMMIPACTEWMAAMTTTGTPASSPPTRGNRSTRATKTPSSNAKGTPRMASVVPVMIPAIAEVAAFPSMYPVTERIESSTTRRRRSAVLGRNRRRKPDHMRGASSMVKKVRMATVTMATSVDTAAAPTENAVAGLSTLVMLDAILDDPCERYFWRWRRNTSRPSGPRPFLASETRVGIWWPKCTAAVTSGSVNR